MSSAKAAAAPAESQALVIDGNATSRSILVAQLREYGIARVVQCSRVQDARARLEHTVYDYVLCEQYFPESGQSGQTLLDDLRRAQMLPFSTVFFMVTAEASYAAVAEAAESALDGYLLKPFTPSALFERLSLARLRKTHLRPIFDAIGEEDFEGAARLCVERFETRRPYWLYAARIGSELLLRLGRHDEARTLFEAVIEARALPWAKLGVARAQIEAGQAPRAVTTLQGLIGDDASFADAYDVLGRAQVEMGQFEEALATYRTAAQLTPDSVVRLQKLGMMAHYQGDRETSAKMLARAAVLGIDSKLFDYQSLVLLAFSQFDARDRKGLERCMADFGRIRERHPSSERLLRFENVVRTLQLILQRQFAQAVAEVRAMAAQAQSPDFDFEAACNLVGLLAVLTNTSIDLAEAPGWIDTVGMRYANTRGLCELMANAGSACAAYADAVRACLPRVNRMAEEAIAHSLGGDPAGAVRQLLEHAGTTLNTKLLDLAQQVLTRHAAKLEPDAVAAHQDTIDALRLRCGSAPARAVLGQGSERKPGELVLRAGRPGGAADGAGGSRESAAGRAAPVANPDGGGAGPGDADPAGMLRLRPV
ncbi:response regulator [Acidovorax sp. NCPPB 4044]|uniref:response regulator n=1 Tax=Acidovorax sp. NCPPB 4044 TaxID=2940490 RepID=UPI00230460C7|nr:response regulator [Acidovorax sp. NCPPB 4044]MDA8522065.1 response regulator [Acidovorax sp. NCPPB 4044]